MFAMSDKPIIPSVVMLSVTAPNCLYKNRSVWDKFVEVKLHNNQHNDTQQSDTQYNNIQQNDFQYVNIVDNVIKHTKTEHENIQENSLSA